MKRADPGRRRLGGKPSRDDVVRRFWAEFIGSEVTKDGDVPGFDSFWSGMEYRARRLVMREAQTVGDSDEAITAGIARVRSYLGALQPEIPLSERPREVQDQVFGQWEANMFRWDKELEAEGKKSEFGAEFRKVGRQPNEEKPSFSPAMPVEVEEPGF